MISTEEEEEEALLGQMRRASAKACAAALHVSTVCFASIMMGFATNCTL